MKEQLGLKNRKKQNKKVQCKVEVNDEKNVFRSCIRHSESSKGKIIKKPSPKNKDVKTL